MNLGETSLTTVPSLDDGEQHHTVFTEVVKANNKHHIKQVVKKLSLMWPDREKKVYVWLAPEDDTLDVANRIGII